ncbi:MAG: hypothetical protein JW849_00015 [Phycisphaerae bacterium]|nr:hypothetical protein [Phycisphaerae bacterium]
MTDATLQPPMVPTTQDLVARCFATAVLLLALGAGACLGVRTLSSPDLGYHLAYGEQFLQSGHIVDSSPEIYTLDSAALARAGELPPGAWIDQAGVYRFPNANWASQVLFALVHRLGNAIALGVLQAGLTAGVLLIATIAMRRLGLTATWSALGILLIAATAYERFMLRPELVGYFVLAVQFALLIPAWRGEGTLRRRRIATLVLLQLLFVNLHSYWLLGLGLTLSCLLGEAVRKMLPRRGDSPADTSNTLLGRLGALFVLQAGVSFVNPWWWRLAVLPAQTLAYFSRHHISAAEARPGGHPWSVIGEFFRPLESPFTDIVATKAFFVLLAIVLVGLLCATLRRRWSAVFLLAGATAVSLSMRRNIAPGAILLTPAALACVAEWLPSRRVWKKLAAFPAAHAAAAGALGCVAAVLLGAVVTNRFYFEQRRADRFGLGISLLNTPVLTAQWLSAVQPKGRLWTDYDASSNVYYFTQFPDPSDPAKKTHPKVPILTNTWAYPPDVMAEVFDVSRGMRPFRDAVKRYGIEVVVLRVWRFTAEPDPSRPKQIPLALALSADSNWALVYLDALHAVFLRKDGSNRVLAFKTELMPENFDVQAYIQRLREMDSIPAFALYQGGKTLSLLGWNAVAIQVLQQATQADPHYAEVWYELGLCHARLGKQYYSLASYQQAESCILESLRLKPDFPQAQMQLYRVRQFSRQLQADQNR